MIQERIASDSHGYYSLYQIYQKKDLKGNKPGIFIITGNRTAGKTTAVLLQLLEEFKETGKRFIIMYRQRYELIDSSKQFADCLNLYPEFGHAMIDKSIVGGMMREYWLYPQHDSDHPVSCGYGIFLKNPDVIKKYSAMFADCWNILFDEFQTETGKYLENELDKFQSVYMSVSRGGGNQSRGVNVYLLSNDVTLMNPYFIRFGIHKRLKKDTRFIRGDGWIFQYEVNRSAIEALEKNAVNVAFKDTGYSKYSRGIGQLYATSSFISKIPSVSRYIFTIKFNDKEYGVRECVDDGILHISSRVEPNCLTTLVYKQSDYNENNKLMVKNSIVWKRLKMSYEANILRFDDIATKNDIFDILGVEFMR